MLRESGANTGWGHGAFSRNPGIGVPRDPSEASHLGLLSWAVTACLDLLIRLQVGLGSYSGRRPQQETRARDNQVTCWLPGPVTGP